MPTWLPIALAVCCLICVPLTPKLLLLRLRFLKWVHWDWAADLLERHFPRWVLLVRAVLILVAAGLLSTGWAR